MNIFQAVITGVVQGLTEFLPVSSSGHLVLTSSIYKYFTGKPLSSGGNEEIFFDIMLHIGTLIALFIYFRTDIVNLTKLLFNNIKNKTIGIDEESKLPFYIILGTIATIAVVYPLKDYFEADMNKPAIVGLQIVITGILLFITEYLSSKKIKASNKLSWKKTIFIGIAQGIAVSPGISRSGSTIAAGLLSGLDRVTCARFSFLLGIPIILIAALYDGLDLLKSGEWTGFNWTAILLGTAVSAIVGYFCIKYFIQFLSKHKLTGFAVYCCIVGLAMFFFFSNVH